MERDLKVPSFGFVRRAQRGAAARLVLQVVVYFALLAFIVVVGARFGRSAGKTVGVVVGLPLLFGVLALGKRLAARSAARGDASPPQYDAADWEGVVPLRSVPGSRFSRLPGVRHWRAPRLSFSDAGLEVAWRWGRFQVAWRDIANVEARPTSLLVRLHSDREIELETVRLPSGWGPDGPELVRAQRAAAIAALGYNEALASRIEARADRPRDAYRTRPD